MSRFAERRRFVALRACWRILSGGAVAWNINFTESGCKALSKPLFISGCQIDGVPLGSDDIWLTHPEPQPDP